MESHTDNPLGINGKYLKDLEATSLDSWLIAIHSSTKRPHEVIEMESSLSWRITKPLRFFRKTAGKIKRNINSAGIKKIFLKSIRASQR